MSNAMPNIVFRDDGAIVVKNVRLSYEHVFATWAREGDPEDKKKYSGKFMMPKDTHKAEIQALGQHIVKLCMDNFKAKIGSDKLFLRDGDASGKPEQEGHFVISASEKIKPKVVDRDGKTLLTAADDKVYSGCYVNVLINPWVQNSTQWGKRINANLLMVQFVDHGERFSGVARPDVADVFSDVSGEFGGDEVDPFA